MPVLNVDAFLVKTVETQHRLAGIGDLRDMQPVAILPGTASIACREQKLLAGAMRSAR